jgi:hypothetical protein
MRKKKRITQISFIVICMMLLSLLGGGTSVAEEPEQGPIAAVTIEAGVISWEPRVENGGLNLTISGPGDFYLRQEYEPGARPTFTPKDSAGNPLPDGVYKYELQLMPVLGEALGGYDESQRGIVPLKGPGKAPVQSGSFSILNGGFVTQDMVEIAADAKFAKLLSPDHVINDDVIIDGSLCVGFDCVNGENFGYDTQILKENNLRIYFNDTSSTASFPTNNWRITINDSTNGGASYFSIDDVDDGTHPFRIEAGAPSNSLYVEDYGRVGLGTSTPVVELHIADGDTPTVRLNQDGSSGWTPQTWDVAGNETNFFIRDATHGSTLPFRIAPGAPSSSLTINSDGNVGIGTWSPEVTLEVESTSSSAEIRVESGATSSDFPILSLSNINSGQRYDLRTQGDQFVITRFGSGVNEFTFEADGDLSITGNYFSGGTQLNVPDYVLEEDYSLMPLGELRAYIAREKHLPNVPSADEITKDGLNLSQFQMRLLEKVEELTLYTLAQQQQIAALEARLEALEAIVESLPQAHSDGS